MFGSVRLANIADPNKILLQDMKADLILVHFFHFQIFVCVNHYFWSTYELFCTCWKQEKNIFILDEGPPQRLDNTTLTAETKYSFNFTQSNKKLCLSWHYNGNNSFLLANAANM